MSSIYRKVIEKIVDAIVTEAICELASYVRRWCSNQAAVQNIRRKLEQLFSELSSRVDRTQQQNAANDQVRELLRQLKYEVDQVIILLDGDPTPSDVSNAIEGMKNIQVISLEIIYSIDPKTKQTKFNPRFLRRRTRFQVIRGCNF